MKRFIAAAAVVFMLSLSACYISPEVASQAAANNSAPANSYNNQYDNGYATCGMNAPDYDMLLATINNESFDDGKLRVIKSAGQYGYLSSAQVAQIVDQMTFDDGKADAAIILYDAVCDRQNWYVVYNAFDFDSTKDKVESAVASKNRGNQGYAPQGGMMPPPPPAQHAHRACGMNQADFEQLVSTVERQSFSDDKLRIVKSATSYGYISAAQAARLIKLITSSQGQEDAAVALYEAVCDRQNWYVVYDSFTFKSTRDSVDRRLGL
jgi:hypothetical protein